MDDIFSYFNLRRLEDEKKQFKKDFEEATGWEWNTKITDPNDDEDVIINLEKIYNWFESRLLEKEKQVLLKHFKEGSASETYDSMHLRIYELTKDKG